MKKPRDVRGTLAHLRRTHNAQCNTYKPSRVLALFGRLNLIEPAVIKSKTRVAKHVIDRRAAVLSVAVWTDLSIADIAKLFCRSRRIVSDIIAGADIMLMMEPEVITRFDEMSRCCNSINPWRMGRKISKARKPQVDNRRPMDVIELTPARRKLHASTVKFASLLYSEYGDWCRYPTVLLEPVPVVEFDKPRLLEMA